MYIYSFRSFRFRRERAIVCVRACVWVCACVCKRLECGCSYCGEIAINDVQRNSVACDVPYPAPPPRLLTDSSWRACRRGLRESFRVTEFVTKLLRFGSNLHIACKGDEMFWYRKFFFAKR